MSETTFELLTLDKKRLHGRAWDLTNPLAMVCLIHGLGEHSGRYKHLAERFNHSGIGVRAIDLRGHGKSPGKRGHARCQELWDDIECLMKQIRLSYLDCPLFLYGHSWGGNLVSNIILRRNSSEIHGAILSSPWLRLSFEPTKMELLLAGLMTKIFPAFTQSNGLKEEYLSRDLSVGEAYINDPLVHTKVSAGLFHDATNNGIYALNHAPEINSPTLIMHGTDDKITSYHASEEFADASSNIKLKLWPDMRHEPHNEFGQEEVLEFVIQWIIKNAV